MSDQTNPPFAYDVFISYSFRDKSWVRGELLPKLDAAGLKTFIDFRDEALAWLARLGGAAS